MKKLFSLILAAALVITTLGLYGCHKSGQGETEPTVTTEATEATNAEATESTDSTEPQAAESTQETGSSEENKAGASGSEQKPDASGGSNTQQPGNTGSSNAQQTGSTGNNAHKPGSTGNGSKPSGSTGSGNGSGSSGGSSGAPEATQPPATEPPATQPPATNPPATEPPATQPPVTEHTHSYAVSSSTPASCTSEGSNTYTCSCGDSYTESIPMTAHNWVHQHQDEVGHNEDRCVCQCGARFSSTAEWIAHTKNYKATEALTNHGSNALGNDYVVDTPAKDWDQCSICGTTK